jgi:hypothetical protein
MSTVKVLHLQKELHLPRELHSIGVNIQYSTLRELHQRRPHLRMELHQQ